MARDAARSMPRSQGTRQRVLSQNLLQDPAAIDRYVSAVGEPGLPGIEVGGGGGSLTAKLADRVTGLTVVELDPAHARALRAEFGGDERITVLQQDFLSMKPPAEPFVLVGNIPFAITTKIVAWAMGAPALRSAVLIAQREYVRRQTGDYGRWTLNVMRSWPEWEWGLGPAIDRDSFRPRPEVDASVLILTRRSQPLVDPARLAAWNQAVETGFRGVGGSLYASLSTIYPKSTVAQVFDRAGVPRNLVVGFVTPQQWLAVFNALDAGGRSAGARPAGSGRSGGPAPSRGGQPGPGTGRARPPRRSGNRPR